ncbi:MAG: hypothetical protein QM607_08630 [Microbacterium sp.]
MPTALKRIQVTQTPRVAKALEAAQQEWPEATRAEQLTRLLTAGAEAVTTARNERAVRRRRVLKQTQGTLEYPPRYLDELREEWPE